MEAIIIHTSKKDCCFYGVPLHFFIIKPTGCTNFTNLFWHETTCFGQFLCPKRVEFHAKINL